MRQSDPALEGWRIQRSKLRVEKVRKAVARLIEEVTGEPFSVVRERRVSGGCIHESFWIEDGQGRSFFLKVNDRSRSRLFETERGSLEALQQTRAIRVPRPVALGISGNRAFFVMEAIALQSRGDPARMGRELAALHRHRPENGSFGWEEDNFIGATVQENGWRSTWVDFFGEKRLIPQFRLARAAGRRFRGESRLLDGLERWIGYHDPAPSLLHGDLWGGNAAFDESGRPVLFDPACYYGDRETDLAFSRMFGGFALEFYEAYAEAWPIPDGEQERREIYNLYHLLNHYNLFGEGYGDSAQRVMDRFV